MTQMNADTIDEEAGVACDKHLPKGWALPRIEDISDLNPRLNKAEIPDSQTVHFIPMPAVEALRNKINVSATRPFSEVKKGYTPFQSNDVIFAKITPCMENGKVAVVPALKHRLALGSTEFHVIRPRGGTLPLWLYYRLSSQDFRWKAESNMTGAVGQRRVPIDFIANSKIPLPPLNEQKRIVAKIEELFSELDAGVENLKTARAQLGVYRQALLKQAFEGKLTEKWRAENPDQIESVEQLLERIRRERENRYQTQLKEWDDAVAQWVAEGTSGKKPPKPRKPKPVSPLTKVELAELPDAPVGWLWMRLGDFSIVTGGLTKNQKRNALTLRIPYLRVANVYANRLDLDDIQEIGVTNAEAKKVQLRAGDLLVVEGNGSKDQIGRVARWDGTIKGCGHQNHLIRVRVLDSHSGEYLLHFLLSPVGRDVIEKMAASTSGLHTLSISKVESITVPLCSLPEQQEIVRLLEEQFSAIEQNEREIDAALERAEALRQSILKKAFSGQLVPQDPNDEPASVLLEQIRTERAAGGKHPKKRAAKKLAESSPGTTRSAVPVPQKQFPREGAGTAKSHGR